VYIYSLEAENTIDGKIKKILENKKKIADSMLAWTKDDLKFLIE